MEEEKIVRRGRVGLTCSECGRELQASEYSFTLDEYTYKINLSDKRIYQCSYTCYHHADLRYSKPPILQTKDQRLKEVESCERAMRGQGKEVLHPIKVK